MKKRKMGFGWKPDLPDARDFSSRMKIRGINTLPTKVDLRAKFAAIPIINQGPLGSCTACAITTAHMACQVLQGALAIIPSKLFLYYNERAAEGSVAYDSGAMIRTGIKSIVKQGVCSEIGWPYDINKYRTKPPLPLYKSALNSQALRYERLQSQILEQLLTCIAEGFPFVFGFTVYDSFDSAKVARTGIYTPNPHAEEILDGHAVTAFGYDKTDGTFLVRNSWGARWGMRGYFKMRFEHVTDANMADDFWRIFTVE